MNSVEEVINALSSYITRNPKSSLIEFLQDSLLDDRDIDNEKDDKLKQVKPILREPSHLWRSQ